MRKQNNYKSKIEIQLAELLGDDATYEPEYIPFLQPAKSRRYCPDFKTVANVYIECKGKWTAEDRYKHVLLKEQHPDKRIVLVFQNPDVKINKRSKTTYGDWATKNGLEWLDWRTKTIPKELISDHQATNRNRKRQG